MENIGWIKLTTTSGSGNSSVGIGADRHTGRNPRTSELIFRATGVNSSITRIVRQQGALEFVSLDKTSITIPYSANTTTVSITGTSNSKRLGITCLGGLARPAFYKINGVSVNNDALIENSDIGKDLGLEGAYTFTITLPVVSNDSQEDREYNVTVQTEEGNSTSCTIISSAGAPFINVPEEEIVIDASGIAKTLSIYSNTSWTIQ